MSPFSQTDVLGQSFMYAADVLNARIDVSAEVYVEMMSSCHTV